MNSRAEGMLQVILACSALAIATSVVYGTFARGRASDSMGIRASPDYIDFWEEALPNTIPIGGDSTAPLTLVVISDLECPVCRIFHSTLAELLAERPEDVYALYMSYPLRQHRFAEASARAAECAHGAGAFRQFLDVIYEKQDSLGLKSWGSFGRDAGIADTASIVACAAGQRPTPGVQAGRDFGDRISIRGTPTVLFNGWRYPYTPTREDLDQALEAVLAGREPRGETRTVAEPERAP